MPRGIKLFGWIFILEFLRFVLWIPVFGRRIFKWIAHLLMGFFFGVLHLAYGAYLYLTEKGKNAA